MEKMYVVCLDLEGVLTPEGESEGAFDDTDDILGDIEAEGNTEDNE